MGISELYTLYTLQTGIMRQHICFLNYNLTSTISSPNDEIPLIATPVQTCIIMYSCQF